MSDYVNKYKVELTFINGAVKSFYVSSWGYGDHGLNLEKRGEFFMHIPYSSYLTLTKVKEITP